jgi:5-methylcytosine-specific restriction endonuclease McrA
MRSVANAATGEETQWAIPTVAVRTYYFGVRVSKGENISLKKLYRLQKGTCQYCGVKIPFSEATKDHIHPRSKHGTNDDSNIALACKRCNSLKADTFPYYDKDGRIPQGVRRHRYHVSEDIVIRPEWKPYMFLE